MRNSVVHPTARRDYFWCEDSRFESLDKRSYLTRESIKKKINKENSSLISIRRIYCQRFLSDLERYKLDFEEIMLYSLDKFAWNEINTIKRIYKSEREGTYI